MTATMTRRVAQGLDDVVHGQVDEVRLAEDLTVDLHPGGQRRLERVEQLVDLVRDRERVGPRGLLQGHHDRRDPAVRPGAPLGGGAEPHVRDLPDRDRRPGVEEAIEEIEPGPPRLVESSVRPLLDVAEYDLAVSRGGTGSEEAAHLWTDPLLERPDSRLAGPAGRAPR